MIRIPWKRMIGMALVCCMLSANTSYAKTTQDNIEDAKQQIDELEDKKQEAENQLNNIEGQKESLESRLGQLNGQLSDIASSMNELETDISEKEAQIEKAKEDLENAEAQSEKQYEDMKVRIQYIYENGSASAWQMLLEATSFSDFLNRTEYVTEINSYDRRLLTEFQELQADIAEQKQALEGDMTELLAMQNEMKEKQNQVSGLISNTKSGIEQTNKALSDVASDVESLEAELARMIEYERQLEIQKAKEDAARLAAIQAEEQEDTSGVVYVPADSDAYLLGAIIQCEAEGESYDGKLAVGSVILNRVKSSYFPNTISGVIYQGGQFSPVASGRLSYRLQTGVDQSCLQAAQEVLNGNVTINCLYFRANNGIIQGIVIGNHVFY